MTAAKSPSLDIRQAGRWILTVLGVGFAITAAFWIFAVRPTIREYRQLRAEYEPRFEELDRRTAGVERREAFLGAVKQAEVDLAYLRGDVLSTREQRMVEVTLELDEICSQFGISLESVSYDHEELLDEGLDRMEMVVPLEGNYASLRRFLQAVEQSEMFFVVERVALDQGREGGVLLELNVTLAVYFTLPEELVQAAAAAERTRRERRRR